MPAVLVLAAGQSQRMGTAKQLLPWNGSTFLRRATDVAIKTGCRPVAVVLGCNAERMRAELAGLDIVLVDNPDWALGMGGSIRAGVAALLPSNPAGILITLCDQPHVDAPALSTLLETFASTGQTVAARFAGTVGVPAVFARSMFPDLLSLDPAAGAKRLLIGGHVLTVDLPTAATDVDTPEDYRKACDT